MVDPRHTTLILPILSSSVPIPLSISTVTETTLSDNYILVCCIFGYKIIAKFNMRFYTHDHLIVYISIFISVQFMVIDFPQQIYGR